MAPTSSTRRGTLPAIIGRSIDHSVDRCPGIQPDLCAQGRAQFDNPFDFANYLAMPGPKAREIPPDFVVETRPGVVRSKNQVSMIQHSDCSIVESSPMKRFSRMLFSPVVLLALIWVELNPGRRRLPAAL